MKHQSDHLTGTKRNFYHEKIVYLNLVSSLFGHFLGFFKSYLLGKQKQVVLELLTTAECWVGFEVMESRSCLSKAGISLSLIKVWSEKTERK